MSRILKFFSIVLLTFGLFSCPSGGNNYGKHRSVFKPSSNTKTYQVYPGQSQLTFSVYPQKQGSPAVVRASIDGGSLYVENNELRGGEANANMESLLLELPPDLSANSSLSDLREKDMFGKTSFSSASLQIAKIVSAYNEETGSTHLVHLNLELRNKKRGLKVPARIVVNQDHVALMSVGMFSVDLTKWGMQPEKGGWQKEGVLMLQIRGDVSGN